MREREGGRAGKRRNQILEDHPSLLFWKLYQGNYLCIRGWWKKAEGSELGHRAKAEKKMATSCEAINFHI